jgi:diguanylate cyclase (GGDEF)-like protein
MSHTPPPPDDEPTLVPLPTTQDRSIRALTSVADALSVEQDEVSLLQKTLESIVGDLGLLGGAAFVHDEDEKLHAAAESGEPLRDANALLELARMVAQWDRPIVREFPQGGWSAATPLQAKDNKLGALAFHAAAGTRPPDREVLRALGRQIAAGLVSARLYGELRASAERSEALARINRALAAGHDLAEGVAELARELRSQQAFDRLICGFVNDSGDYLEIVSDPAAAGWGLGAVLPVVGSGPGFAVLNDRPVLEPDLVGSHRFIEDMRLLDEGVRSYLLLPLRTRGRCVGVLGLAAHTPVGFDDAALVRMQPVANAVAMALDNLRLLEKTKQLSVTDELTPLYNARFFHQMLERELKFVDRYKSVLSIVFLDLDRFKPVNDTYGHLRGSRVLREVGFLLREAVRETDYPARYGGDEFVVVLPQTDEKGAALMAERLQQAIAEHEFLQEEGIDVRLGASAGTATYPSEAQTKEALIRLADERMYKNKDARRASQA